MSLEGEATPSPQKFMLPQALRGIAATWVMFHHAYWGRHIVHLYAALPQMVAQVLFLRGFYGVEIFFVLSGFIIAHSIRGAEVTGRYIRDFAIRRSIRLDPPYWAAIAFAVVMGALSARVVHKAYEFPSAADILSHITYTQMIFGYPFTISGVFWTLTFEVQFYLVLVISMMLFQKLARRLGVIAAALIVFGPLYAIAWIWGVFIPGANTEAFFYVNWYGFFAGALGYWAASKRSVVIPFWALAIGLLLLGRDISQVCAVTAVLLHVTLKNGSIVRTLSNRPLQFLGTISYSLYLTHTQVQGASMYLLYKFIPRTVGGEAVALILSALTCIAAAAFFWWIIERPSHALAKRFGGRTRRRAEACIPPDKSADIALSGATPLP
jgi:peptidoglycan/LPS O-acetylase OafA/YrhL